MVGRKKRKSNPVIFFCCDDVSTRVKARDAVKSSAIMKDYPAIRLGHVPFAPESKARPVFLTRTEETVLLEGEKNGQFRRAVFNPQAKSSNGVQIIIAGNTEYPFTTTATVGGFISLKGKIYGLTAAHGLHINYTQSVLDSEGRLPRTRDFEYEPVGGDGSDDCRPCSIYHVYVLCGMRSELMVMCSR